MLSREARELTGLDKEEFLFVMKNYTELKSLAQDDDARRFFKGESYRSEDSQD